MASMLPPIRLFFQTNIPLRICDLYAVPHPVNLPLTAILRGSGANHFEVGWPHLRNFSFCPPTGVAFLTGSLPIVYRLTETGDLIFCKMRTKEGELDKFNWNKDLRSRWGNHVSRCFIQILKNR